MAKKPRTTKPGDEEFEPFDPSLDEFEEFDVAAEPLSQEATIEALGGLGAGEDEYRALVRAQEAIEKKYLLEPAAAASASAAEGTAGLGNVVGAGIGEKLVDGMPTGQLAVKVLVKEKLSDSDIASHAMVPDSMDGVPTDVDAVGD